MFGMIPFDRRDSSLFDMLDNFERNFFGTSSNTASSFRTDIRDAGDRFILEAELPGFQKEDIKLDVKDGILTITAEHSERRRRRKTAISAVSAATAPSAAVSTCPASRRTTSPPPTTTACWS